MAVPVAVSLASFSSRAGRIIRVNSAYILPDLIEWMDTAPLSPLSNLAISFLMAPFLTAGISQVTPRASSRSMISVE